MKLVMQQLAQELLFPPYSIVTYLKVLEFRHFFPFHPHCKTSIIREYLPFGVKTFLYRLLKPEARQ